ncbi:hypothetical protein [Methylobacterium nonmethylotrophicum]|uniref:von Hippel-Lindau disease tumour suppressor beta domain-containing protein n=1 Tax=Methylobacterium nonmethylotrophicum TaxID=1141884 RepID=A0A4Z0NP03_9HYPH|nr:hypothetical protein [Methylobacterium nonmethylotrophicum]TGD97963.1 hypothetical protein EU555_17530 [Methylobacterium nonmethylotrophicum]
MDRHIRRAPACALVLGTIFGLNGVAAHARCDSDGFRSINSDRSTKIKFVNQSRSYRAIYWIDFNGKTKSYGGLNSGESKTINTFLTHPWMITNGPGDCIQIVMPKPAGSVVRIIAEDARGRGE